MPIYEYECESCHQLFELVQSFNAPTTMHCQFCTGKAHRLISNPAILFKGSGFYVTDSARKSTAGTSGTPAPKPETESKPKAKETPASPKKSSETKKPDSPPPASPK